MMMLLQQHNRVRNTRRTTRRLPSSLRTAIDNSPMGKPKTTEQLPRVAREDILNRSAIINLPLSVPNTV